MAYLHLRHSASDRADAFAKGLKKLGFKVFHGLTNSPRDGDIAVLWNRIGHGDAAARAFEADCRPVLVAENAAWGNGFMGQRWLSLARNRHNTAGMFPVGDADRWDDLGVELKPWRREGETVILPQRGIGSPPTAMPREWPQAAFRRYGGRVRPHPGRNPAKPLQDDLARAGRVVTWGSGAAIQALMMGIPVISEMPGWVGEQLNTDESRLAMFRRLAWAQATLDEIEDGSALERLLDEHPRR